MSSSEDMHTLWESNVQGYSIKLKNFGNEFVLVRNDKTWARYNDKTNSFMWLVTKPDGKKKLVSVKWESIRRIAEDMLMIERGIAMDIYYDLDKGDKLPEYGEKEMIRDIKTLQYGNAQPEIDLEQEIQEMEE